MAAAYEDIDDFTITFRQEIVFYLRQLINEGERVTVMFDDGRENLLTILLHVDENKDLLIFDWGGSEKANRQLLNSPHAYFVANPIGVRNQFAAGRCWETTYEGRPAFATHLPKSFIRLQRRQFFRLTLPLTKRPLCRFTVGRENTQWVMAVVDIGIGGIGLEAQGKTLPFEVDQVIPNATIDLDKYGRLEIDLEVRHVESVIRADKQVGRMGCRFIDLKPAHEQAVQRFIAQMQREERARLG